MENETEEQARANSRQALHGKCSLTQNARRAQMSWDVNSWCVGGAGSTKTLGNTRSNLNEFLASGFPETFKMPKVVMSFQKEKLYAAIPKQNRALKGIQTLKYRRANEKTLETV